MCLLTVCNLHDEALNKRMVFLLQSLGSSIHKDGWGWASRNGETEKCSLAANLTSNYGAVLHSFSAGDDCLVGHIRQASPQIPVTNYNAHPFVGTAGGRKISFMHNGKLSPKDEKKFVMKYDVEEEETNAVTKVVTKVKKTYSISDSKIFFEHFMTVLSANPKDGLVSAVKKAMEDFTGKFAFVIRDFTDDKVYIFKGRTADLHILYHLDEENPANILGFVVHTNKDILLNAGGMLSNLQQLDGNPSVEFSFPSTPLQDEKVYLVEDLGIKEIDTIKENAAPVSTYGYNRTVYKEGWEGYNWDNQDDTGTGSRVPGKKSPERKIMESIFKFMDEFSLSRFDLNKIFYVLYGISVLEVDEETLKHFCKKWIPKFAPLTTKTYRQRLKKALGFSSMSYYSLKADKIHVAFPWMLSTKAEQLKMIEHIEKMKGK